MTSIDEIVRELTGLMEKATPGPWLAHGPSADPTALAPIQWQHYYEIRVDSGGKDEWPYRIAATAISTPQSAHDFALIAAARNHLPALLSALARSRRMEEALRNAKSLTDSMQGAIDLYQLHRITVHAKEVGEKISAALEDT